MVFQTFILEGRGRNKKINIPSLIVYTGRNILPPNSENVFIVWPPVQRQARSLYNLNEAGSIMGNGSIMLFSIGE